MLRFLRHILTRRSAAGIVEGTDPIMELRIFDLSSDDSGLLVSLAGLLEVLEKEVPAYKEGGWKVFQYVDGYGERVGAIEDALEGRSWVVVDPESILDKLLSGEEYFNHVWIKVVDFDMEFGTHDSSFHFVRAGQHILEVIAGYFYSTEVVKPQGHRTDQKSMRKWKKKRREWEKKRRDSST